MIMRLVVRVSMQQCNTHTVQDYTYLPSVPGKNRLQIPGAGLKGSNKVDESVQNESVNDND